MGDGMSDTELGVHWRTMVAREEVLGGLEDVYADAMREIAQRQPVCDASGRCCKFEQYGHRLYVTGLEAAYTVVRLDTEATQRLQSPGVAGKRVSLTVLDASSLERARDEGGCPFQIDGLCSVHTIKPLACRTYFCDPTSTQWQHDLTERMHARIVRLHEEYAVEYRYAEWRAMLSLVVPTDGVT